MTENGLLRLRGIHKRDGSIAVLAVFGYPGTEYRNQLEGIGCPPIGTWGVAGRGVAVRARQRLERHKPRVPSTWTDLSSGRYHTNTFEVAPRSLAAVSVPQSECFVKLALNVPGGSGTCVFNHPSL